MSRETIPWREVLEEALADPEIRAAWEQSALARAVANRLIKYRLDNQLTQRQLAERLGMRQSAVARLEDGEHNPSLAMLYRLSRALDIEFNVNITPGLDHPRLLGESLESAQVVERFQTSEGNRVVIAAT